MLKFYKFTDIIVYTATAIINRKKIYFIRNMQINILS